MVIVNNDLNLFVDIDNTLATWKGDNWEGHAGVIKLIKKFHRRGLMVIAWSAGGAQWAASVVKELKLEEYVSYCMAKPRWFCDDLHSSKMFNEFDRITPEELL